MRPAFIALCLTLPIGALAADPAYERDPIRYSESIATTPITKIADRIQNGEPLLNKPSGRENLLELLELLDIPKESQILVYSKTSAQNGLISPKTPRAIYFNENTYIGWVPGGNIETISFDKKLGAVFHMIHLAGATDNESPKILRHQSCLDCHAGSRTKGFPGLVARSVIPMETGRPILHAGTFTIDDTSPISERWGGWYVTGETGDHSHLGNIIGHEEDEQEVTVEKIKTEPLTDLASIINTDKFPGGAQSDVVALMVFEHQINVHNALVRANHTARQTLYRHRTMTKLLKEPKSTPLSESSQGILDSAAEDVVRALLYADEFIMENDGPEGADDFYSAFLANAQADSEGRSLKDFRLYERLFKYRCSYLIYSDPFQHLPPVIKSRVLNKLHTILTSPTPPADYEYLSDTERERINHILKETLPDWPASVAENPKEA
ncbi:MAG: hypothetical protein AAF591_20020 [Verrucomicrobiota bacterium]